MSKSRIVLRFKSITKYLLYCIVCVACFCGCKNCGTSSDEEIDDEIVHLDMQYFDFDSVGNLSLFFDSISGVHGIPIRNFVWEESANKEITDCMARLEQYRQGKGKFYPDNLVRECINTLSHECAFLANHGSELDMTYAEWFLMLAAYYSPDITYLVQMQTPNHRVGVNNFGSRYNDAPWWSYIFIKRDKGFEVRRINGDYTKIERIYQMEDEKGNLYYLCSNSTTLIEFLQVLYWAKSEDNIVCVAKCDSLPVHNTNFDRCYFNPEKMSWFCCKEDKNSGKLIPISENPALVLKLNEDNSRFEEN